ncbi:MAG: hypothetical protein ACRC33_21875 [Gemmataceae bacterium]
MTGLCDHCERPRERDESGLCPACAATEAIRILYVRRRGWTPELEARVRELTRRARLRLPLFDPEESAP